MRSFVTSYNGLFAPREADGPAVAHIEIPLIQRDYAQGREDAEVQRIRANFLDVLHQAVTAGNSVSLDFVFGDVEHGTLRPLDGQQRLTTLFLLHWYLAFRAERLDEPRGWKNFSYATRPGARVFCQRLAGCTPPHGIAKLSAWIEDQTWYLYTWHHDPTIQSMLVMVDAINERFREDDCGAAWERLVDPRAPAISFHLLPIERMGLSEDLYIKMNSRGKPLTPFETFKARFEKTLETSCPKRVEAFARKVDGAWTDLLWPYRGDDAIVDHELLRYFDFVTALCEWNHGRVATGAFDGRIERLFGGGDPKAPEYLDFLIGAFDVWADENIEGLFSGLFATRPQDESGLLLFPQQAALGVNLFAACCRHYERLGSFTWPHTLLLYAVMLHKQQKTADISRRLRVLRNLAEASGSELRSDRMPALISDVTRIAVDGSLADVATFNQAQVAEERLKADFCQRHPEVESVLFQLEDHPMLRGSLVAFELDASTFERRAKAFTRVFADGNWAALTGALLATGDYSRSVKSRFFRFGSSSSAPAWREILAGSGRTQLERTRQVLAELLDEIAGCDGDVRESLDAIQSRWLKAREEASHLDWRYYFVKYPAMREGKSGIYVGARGALGYSVCMLNKKQMNSWYRDPYLLAIWRESGVAAAVHDPWFTGYETGARWMRLVRSGAGLRCVESGIAVEPPSSEEHKDAFTRVCQQHGIGEDQTLLVSQGLRDGHQVDNRDRVMLGAALLRDLIAAGL